VALLPAGRCSSWEKSRAPAYRQVELTLGAAGARYGAGGLVDALFLSNWIYSGEWEEWDCSMARGARVGRK